MSGGNDIIRWVIDRMMAHEDSITQELALTVEREARAEWGGRSIDYINKHCAGDRRSRRPLSAEAARAVYEAGLTNVDTRQIVEQQGVSRATLYRLMKRGVQD